MNWFWRRFRGASKQAQANGELKAASGQSAHARWLTADQNEWGIPVLDVRPLTQGMLSVSSNPVCAQNAVSFRRDDGSGFIGERPAESNRSVAAALRYPIDRCLADGVLFTPTEMEDKWAIFLHRRQIIFVRSWMRQVWAVADLEIDGEHVTLSGITGSFARDADDTFTVRAADYLIRTHAMGQSYPAPLAADQANDANAAAMWCMSAWGRMAQFATPHSVPTPATTPPLRTNSLLHIAVARGDVGAVAAQLDAGVDVDVPARDGAAPLSWAIGAGGVDAARLLLSRGCSVDSRSADGATPLMIAVQRDEKALVDLLLEHGANVNVADARGFTALHRAAEMGKVQIVQRLLAAGATRDVLAQGHTPASLAQTRGETQIVDLLGA